MELPNDYLDAQSNMLNYWQNQLLICDKKDKQEIQNKINNILKNTEKPMWINNENNG